MGQDVRRPLELRDLRERLVLGCIEAVLGCIEVRMLKIIFGGKMMDIYTRLRIWATPPILILFIKRFREDRSALPKKILLTILQTTSCDILKYLSNMEDTIIKDALM